MALWDDLKGWLRGAQRTAATEAGKVAAREALRAAQPEIMRGVTKGVIHRNTASRKVSRLAQRVKAIGATA